MQQRRGVKPPNDPGGVFPEHNVPTTSSMFGEVNKNYLHREKHLTTGKRFGQTPWPPVYRYQRHYIYYNVSMEDTENINGYGGDADVVNNIYGLDAADVITPGSTERAIRASRPVRLRPCSITILGQTWTNKDTPRELRNNSSESRGK